jgi:hypothetical protein
MAVTSSGTPSPDTFVINGPEDAPLFNCDEVVGSVLTSTQSWQAGGLIPVKALGFKNPKLDQLLYRSEAAMTNLASEPVMPFGGSGMLEAVPRQSSPALCVTAR